MKITLYIFTLTLFSSCLFQNDDYESIIIKESTNFILEDCKRELRCFQADYYMNPDKIGTYFHPVESAFDTLLKACTKIETGTSSKDFSTDYSQAIESINKIIKSKVRFASTPFIVANDSLINLKNKNILANNLARQFSRLLLHVYSYVDASYCGFEYLTYNENKLCDELSTKFTLKSRYIQSFNGISKKIEIDSILTPTNKKINLYETKIDSSFGHIIVPNNNLEKLRVYGTVKLVGSNGDEREYPIEIE